MYMYTPTLFSPIPKLNLPNSEGNKNIVLPALSTVHQTCFITKQRMTVNRCYDGYAIPHVTKRKTDSGQKSRYYATILSYKEDCGLSLHQRGMQVSSLASVSVRSC